MVDEGFFRSFVCSKCISQLLSLVSCDRMWSPGEREEEGGRERSRRSGRGEQRIRVRLELLL